jgi:hypothetical protein
MAMIIFKMPRVGAPGTVVMILFATLTSIGCRDSAPEETTISRKGAFISKEDAFQVAVEYIKKERPEFKEALTFYRKAVDIGAYWVVTFVYPHAAVGRPNVVFQVDKQRKRVVNAFRA